MRPLSKSASQILLEKRLSKAREDIQVFTSVRNNNFTSGYNPELTNDLNKCIDIAIKDLILTKKNLLDDFGIITDWSGKIIGHRSLI
jgi:hypothetical protein